MQTPRIIVLAFMACGLAAAPAVAQPGGYDAPVRASEVRSSAQRFAAARAGARRGFDEVRNALAAYRAVAGLMDRISSANGAMEPDAARALRRGFGVTREGARALLVVAADRCRAAALHQHVVGRELRECMGASRTPAERRIDARRLTPSPARPASPSRPEPGSVEESRVDYAQALASLASLTRAGAAPEPEIVASLLRWLATAEISVGDVASARRRLAGLGRRVEDDVVRADVDFVAGDLASAQQRLRTLTGEHPSSVLAHAARAQLAMNVFVLGDRRDAALADEVLDQARAAMCVADATTPRELVMRAIELVEGVLEHARDGQGRTLGVATQPPMPLVLAPQDLPPWSLPAPLDPQAPSIESCGPLLLRVAPGARVHPPWAR